MKWSDLFIDILPHVPGCPEFLVESTIRRTAVQFCRETHVWEEQLSDIYPISSIKNYRLKTPAESAVIALAGIWHKNDGNPRPVDDYPSMNSLGMLTFKNAPDSSKGPMEVYAILKPSSDATQMPDAIGEQYREGLIGGTLHTLMTIPKKDWTDPSYAQVHLAKYYEAVGEARYRKANGTTQREMRVQPRHLL